MILSLAWTTQAFLAGKKTCTRRRWTAHHMATWQKAWDEGRYIHDAWDKSPRSGGRCIGQIRLTCRPYWERLADMPTADLVAEGNLWASMDEFLALFPDPQDYVAVLRFEPFHPSADKEEDQP
jgi:hypothetical protein